MLPSVTMMEGRRVLAVRKPLTNPASAPTQTPSSTASGVGICSEKYTPHTPDRATIAPTDRSMPPVRMTNVMPAASMPLIAVWRIMFKMLVHVKNCESSTAKMMKVRMTTSTMPILSRYKFIRIKGGLTPVWMPASFVLPVTILYPPLRET